MVYIPKHSFSSLKLPAVVIVALAQSTSVTSKTQPLKLSLRRLYFFLLFATLETV